MRTTDLLPTSGFSASTSFGWDRSDPFAIDLSNSAGDILFHASFRLPDRQIVLNRNVGGEWGRQLKLFHEPRDWYGLRIALEADRLTLSSGDDILAVVTGQQFSIAETDLEVSSIVSAGLSSRWSVQDHELFSRLLSQRNAAASSARGYADHKVLVVLCDDVFEAARAPHVLADLWDAEVWVYGRDDRAICKIDASQASPVRLYRRDCDLSDLFGLLGRRPGVLALLNLPHGADPLPVWPLPASARSAYLIRDEVGQQFPDPAKPWRATFRWDDVFPLTTLFGSPILDPAYLINAVKLHGGDTGPTHPLMIKTLGAVQLTAVYESPSVLFVRVNNRAVRPVRAPGNLSFGPGASVVQAFAQIASLLSLSGVEFVAIASPALEPDWRDIRFSLASDRIIALHDGVKVDAILLPRALFVEAAEALTLRSPYSLTLAKLLAHPGLDLLDEILGVIRPETRVARMLKQELPRREAAALELAPVVSSVSLEHICRELCPPPGQPMDLSAALAYLAYAGDIGDIDAMTALVEALHARERDAELNRLAHRARRSPLARRTTYFDFMERLRELGYTGLAATLFPLKYEAPSQRAYELGFDCLVRLGEFEAARRWRMLHQLRTDYDSSARARQPQRMGTELILAANHGDWEFVAERRALITQLAEDHWHYRNLRIMADIETGAYADARAAIAASVRTAGDSWESRRFALRIAEETGDARGKRQVLEAIRKTEPELAPLFQPDSFFEQHGEIDRFADAGLSCICVVRNEMYRLPNFFHHYRELGVKNFAFIDNMSTDGTFEYLVEQNDVVIFRTAESYKASRYGVSWHNQIARTFMPGQWVLTVDTDELLVFPGQERVGLPGLCEDLEREGYEAFYAPMIDMYSDKPLTMSGFTPDRSLIEDFPYFDGDGYQHYWTPACGYRALTGGLRGRIFWNFRVKPKPQPPALNKTPLVKFGPDTMYFSSTHEVSPRRVAPQSGALLHFKFLPDFHRRAVEEVRRQEHFAGAREYEIYMNKLQENPHSMFMYEGSTRYTGIHSLVAAGLVRTGPRDNPEPAARLTPAMEEA